MAESHVVSALVSKRAEIAGLIARTEQQLGQFRADLVHLDATLRLFAPGLEPKTIPAKRIRQADLWFEHGELPRRVLDALRRAGAPIHAPDVVRAVMIDKGLDPAAYYNGARTHLSLNKDAPVPRAVQPIGRILPTPILGGLHHHYVRI
jgi:hypothetical protein